MNTSQHHMVKRNPKKRNKSCGNYLRDEKISSTKLKREIEKDTTSDGKVVFEKTRSLITTKRKSHKN